MGFKIGDKTIDENSPVFIIAELSANHGHKFENAVDTIKAAKKAGADAIKLQTYTADTITIDCDNDYFRIKQGTIWDGKTLYNLYKEAYTPWEWQPELMRIAKEEGLICFSSPFDYSAVDFLETLNVPAYKVASFEITDIPLVEYMASKGKPMIISTGIASMGDIDEAISACRRNGNNNIALLKCTSEYPAPLERINLMTIPNMKDTFGVEAGLSDHTMGISIPVGAVAVGAKIIEKHFIVDRKIGGPDASFSLEPHEFSAMVQSIREVEKALGRVEYEMTEKKLRSREFSRSLFVVEEIKKGEKLTEKNIKSIRPGYGMAPKFYKDVMGKTAREDIKRGTPLSWNIIE